MSRYIDVNKIEYHEDDAVYRHEINAMPTADVRENVHGEWKDAYDDWGEKFMWYECSICKYGLSWKANFCPNCGAEMKGEENE